ncbi:hypothetical protein ACRAKI_20505 [Saccharothrix isguenensis]
MPSPTAGCRIPLTISAARGAEVSVSGDAAAGEEEFSAPGEL